MELFGLDQQFWGSLGIAAPFVAAGYFLLKNLIQERALDRQERALDRERLYKALDRATAAHEVTNAQLGVSTQALDKNTQALKDNAEAMARYRPATVSQSQRLPAAPGT